MKRFGRSRAGLVILSLLLSGAVFGLFQAALAAAARLAALLPSAGPDNPKSQHAREIYRNLAEKPVTITGAEITGVNLRPDGAIQRVDPFHQLLALHATFPNRSFLIAAAVVIAAALAVAVVPRLRRVAVSRWWAGVLIIVSNGVAALGVLVYCTITARGFWDEIFVFATEARHFAETGVPAVPTTGGGVAESSADLGVTIVGGAFMRVFPNLHGETAIVLALIVIPAVLSVIAAFSLRSWFSASLPVAVIAPIVVIQLLPQAVLSTEAAMATAAAAAAFAYFALTLLHAFRTGKTLAFAVFAVPLSVIRWEYGLVAVGAAALLAIVWLVRRRRFHTAPRVRDLALLVVPPGFFVLETAIRLTLYGTWGPEGALSKGVGVDGAFLSSGLRYLAQSSWVNLWPLMLALLVIGVLAVHGFRRSWAYVLVVAVCLVPLANSILAGGDWFPIVWERYVASSYSAIVLVTVATLCGVAERDAARVRPVRPWIAGTMIAVYLLTQAGSYGVMYGDGRTPVVEARTNCLARAGLAIGRIIPAQSGLASAEVNTVAYFADQPLTDLIGLVDRRVGEAPPSPMTPGNLLHRKSMPSVIYQDLPGAIYLYEGAGCPAAPYTAAADVTAWNALLGSEITRYRAGSVAKLLTVYRPVTLRVPGEVVVRVLIRRDLPLPTTGAP